VGQIARENEVHPGQVTQWKGVIRDHLPERFGTPVASGRPGAAGVDCPIASEDGAADRGDGLAKKKCKQLGL
jgi:hypothetical protein